VWITQGDRWVLDPDVSPDGDQVVYSSLGEKQEDLFVIKSDGIGERHKLTNDHYKDRGPRWSPDGRQIAFYSNRSGTWEIWTINADGGGLRQLTFVSQENAFWPFWSPDGTRLVYTTRRAVPFIIEVAKPWWEQTPQVIASAAAPQARFWPRSWSADGKRIVGSWRESAGNAPLIISSYSVKGRRFEPLNGFETNHPMWMNDDRRVLFLFEDRIYLVDSRTKQSREVLSAAPHKITRFTLARDNRWLYFSREENEADIWLLSRE
jgi:eukaryotic-like serine/threonine-protein kinase